MTMKTGRVRMLIVRHGETDCNVQGIIQGQLDTDLNNVGRRQAELVGAALQYENIQEAYSSPLRRAKDTADAIVAANVRDIDSKSGEEGIAYWLDDRLKERGFGSLEGKTFDRSKPKRDSIDGIEKMGVLLDRLASFLSDVLSRAAPFVAEGDDTEFESEWVDVPATRKATLSRPLKEASSTAPSSAPASEDETRTVLIVAHGAAISALVGSLLLDMGLASIAAEVERTRIWNCSITEVTVDTSRLPVTKGKVDLKTLMYDKSRKDFVIERWAGESVLQ
jgi:broad specificity phosphatase PhoE